MKHTLLLLPILFIGAPSFHAPFVRAEDEVGEEKKDAIPRPKPVTPPKTEDIDKAIERGVEFLLKDQNKDGSWGTPERTKALNIYAPVPGAHHAFQAAVTSLCVSALIELDRKDDKTIKAIERGEEFLMEKLPKVRRAAADALYNVWTHGYGIQALVRMHGRLPKDQERRAKIIKLIEEQIELLTRFESVDGGWGYYDFRAGTKKPASSSLCFTTSTILIALHEAKGIGAKVPDKLVKAAYDSVIRQRKPDTAYLYGEYLKMAPMASINRPGGCLGRAQVCNLALKLWGCDKITNQIFCDWLDRLFARNGWLDIGRKRPIPHETHFGVAGYFYYYGHYYASMCIEQVKPDQRDFYRAHLATVLLSHQEQDGSWWDFPLYNYHQQYGTAFALMSLKRTYPAKAEARR